MAIFLRWTQDSWLMGPRFPSPLSQKETPIFRMGRSWEDHGKIMGMRSHQPECPYKFHGNGVCWSLLHMIHAWGNCVSCPTVLVCELQVRPRGMKIQGTSQTHWSIWVWYGALTWLKGQITGNHGFYLQIQVFPISHQPFLRMVLVNSKHGW